MFLTNHMENRHLSKFQLKIIPTLEKPHVSDEPHGKSPFDQISAQTYFEFRKTYVSDEPRGISPFVQISAQNNSEFGKATCF